MTDPSFLLYTPSVRYDFVPRVYKSLKPFMNKYDIKWYICYDSWEPIFNPELDVPNVFQLTYKENGGVAGNHQRDKILDITVSEPDRIAFSMDDDSIIHPDFFPVLQQVSRENPTKRGFLFHDMLADDSVIKALPSRIKEGHVGNQNFAMKRSLIGNTRFNIHYCSDGELIEKLYKQNYDDFIFIDRVLAYHNRTLWRTDWEEFIVKE